MNLQKIEFVLVMIVLVFNIFLLYMNSDIFFDFIDRKKEIVAPHDFIPEESIVAYPNQVVLKIENYSINKYAPTGSMIPVLDKGANGISIKPNSEDDLHIGDIITFRENNELIVHRIIEKGIDENGIYFITKGDNNNVSDGKIRFSQIEGVLVALIY